LASAFAFVWFILMKLVVALGSIILGISIGSFLNVLISRFGRKKKWFQGRSVCDHCRRKLKWWENIPLFSFLFLRGRCHTCHSPIPIEYPLVELITGLIFFLVVYRFFPLGFFLASLFLLIAVFLIAVFLFDLHYRIIPDWALIGLVILSFLVGFLTEADLVSQLVTGLVFSLFFLALHLITKGKGMGLGDVKFAFFMGFFLGWPKIVIAFYLAFLTGAVFGVILILLKKKRFGQKIAFGPFLAGATFISWFWGGDLFRLIKNCLW